jgi:hypothetical protein
MFTRPHLALSATSYLKQLGFIKLFYYIIINLLASIYMQQRYLFYLEKLSTELRLKCRHKVKRKLSN